MTESGKASVPVSVERDLLTQAEDALHSIALRLLAVSPKLKEPYTDAPDLSPWSMSIGPLARRAHDLALAIRKHLGLPYGPATRALGTPPLTAADALRQNVADLHMAGVKTGEQYEALVREVLSVVYAPGKENP